MSSHLDRRPDAWSALLGAHALAIRAIEARFKAANLPPLGWYDVLLELEKAGGRLRAGELGDRVVVEPYNITRLLDRLTAEGLVERQKDASDRRVVIVGITDEGVALRRKIWPDYRRAIADILAPLSDGEVLSLVRIMRKTIAGLRDGKVARD